MALIDVVKWDNPGDLFVWKFPESELSTKTQLIVNESQEALLFKGGKRMDTYGAGRHTLSTENIPILNKIINLPFGGQSPFSAEVWFVNKAIPLDIKWGTAAPIQLEDPKYEIVVPVRAFGQFGLQITDAGKFVTKLVGATDSFDRATMSNYFKGILMTQIKDAIAEAMVKRNISILEISTELVEVSELIQNEVTSEFDDYGLQLKSFKVMSISVPEDDPSYVMLKDAKANAAKRKIEGFTYTQERSFDVMETAAGNEGGAAGTMVGAGVGLGMGLGVGGQMGNMMGQTMNTGGAPPQPPGGSPPNPFGAAAPGLTFHVLLNGQQMGPYGTDILQQGVGTGQMTAETMVWRAGMPQWLPAGQVPELSALFAGATPPPPPPNTPPAPPTPPTDNTES